MRIVKSFVVNDNELVLFVLRDEFGFYIVEDGVFMDLSEAESYAREIINNYCKDKTCHVVEVDLK